MAVETYTVEQMLEALHKRRANGRYGIGLAKQYLAPVHDCFGAGGLCPEKAFGLATPEVWQQTLKEADSKLVYCDASMEVKTSLAERTPGACMDFIATVTSVKRDRDGDVLEPSGAIIDEKMLFLWMHMPFAPIGKFIAVTMRNSRRIQARFALIDNELGRDAAQLIEFGAIRISHGFKPLKFEPIYDDDDDSQYRYPTGFHILEYEMMEVSGVSIPSNTDATIQAYSREKLHHPAVKAWAKSLWKQQGARASVPDGVPTVKLVVEVAGQNGKPDEHKCSCGGGRKDPDPPAVEDDALGAKDLEELLAGKPYPNDHACRLRDPKDFQADSFRRTKRKHEGKTYGVIMGKLKGKDSMTEQSYRYPKDDWTVAEARAHCKSHDGIEFAPASTSADPPVVKDEEGDEKAKLKKASGQLKTAIDHPDMPGSCKEYVQNAKEIIDGMLNDDGKGAGGLVGKLLAGLVLGGDDGAVRRAHDELGQVVLALERQKDRDAWQQAALLAGLR